MSDLFDENGFARETMDIVFYSYKKKGNEYVCVGGEQTVIFVGTAVPPDMTIEPPPTAVPEGSSVFWLKGDNIWVVDEDHINSDIYLKETGEKSTVVNRGPIPEGWTLKVYPGSDYKWSDVANDWEMIPEAKLEKEVKQKCSERQTLLDKLLGLIGKCDMLIAAGVNVDFHTDAKKKYQEQLKELYNINPELTPEIELPIVEDLVL